MTVSVALHSLKDVPCILLDDASYSLCLVFGLQLTKDDGGMVLNQAGPIPALIGVTLMLRMPRWHRRRRPYHNLP